MLRCFSQQLYPHALLELVDLTIVTHILITALQNSTEQSLPESWHCPSQFTLYRKEGRPGKWNHLPHAKNNTWTLVAINSLIPIEGIPIPNSSLVTSLLLFLSSSQSILSILFLLSFPLSFCFLPKFYNSDQNLFTHGHKNKITDDDAWNGRNICSNVTKACKGWCTFRHGGGYF